MTAEPVIGVLGLGSIGRRHARLLAERRAGTVPAYDADPAAAHDVEDVRMADGIDALLAECDGVVIATPDALHAPHTIAACAAGVAVLVEKPVSDSPAAAREMAEVAAGSQVPVLVGHVLRHLPVLERAAALVADGSIGRPESFHLSLGAFETLQVARMRFAPADRYRLPFDYSHEWHYLQWLLGPVRRVAAVGHTARGLAVIQEPNVIDALLAMESGATGTVHLDYVERDGARTARIIGDAGVLDLDLRAGALRLSGPASSAEESHAEERDGAFRRQLAHFVDVVAGAAPLVTIADATRAIVVAEAVVRSCEDGTWQAVAA